MKVSAVVFDLDGTLVDSRPDLARAVNRMRHQLALGALAEATIGTMIGEGARVLVDRALADAPPAVSRSEALTSFLQHCAAVCTVATRPYDGIEELLVACERRWPLALLTNKPLAMTRALIDHLGWGAHFRAVVGGDSLAYRKPDGRGLAYLAQALDVAVERVVLVGDSRIDAETANAAGAAFVWVEWGYAAAEDRPRLAGGLSARTPAALADRLDTLLQ